MRLPRLPLFLGLIALVLVIAGWWLSHLPLVPRRDGGTCSVRIGQQRNTVLKECGMSCGGGAVPKGMCGSSFKATGWIDSLVFPHGLCSNECDVYRDVAVCYSGREVVNVRSLPANGFVASACSW
jgi:hypothetical protein